MRRTVKYATALMAGLMMTAWGGIIALAGEWNFTGPESWQWEYHDDNGNRAEESPVWLNGAKFPLT